MLVSGTRDAHSSRFSDGLESSRDVHPVSEEVAPLYHHIADMHPDAEPDLAVPG
jgi:hypothetical protein